MSGDSQSGGSQLQLPESFLALYLAPQGQRALAPRPVILERFELCEDLSQTLVEPARGLRSQLGISDEDVLERIHRGLLAPESSLSMGEARWVVGRLAEHLDWQDAFAALPIATQR